MIKRFPPHLSNASTLVCETRNVHYAHATIELLKKTPELIPPRLWPPNSPDLNRAANLVLKILQQKLHKTCIKLLMTPLTNGCRNDDMI